ncbi:hypothetical protein BU26DRAFT_343815 [Trematosphaeria pertusa]|uniref:Uncharacterized protein n=1 Tax=Trematosphaeria pertusa TaxID=390896 RepID=A0A6A6IAD6_9PLEO|nr:uncharacterized protein BU26DRAFT_343815 [Trematosphaeria pertusa]KAF2247209.1 hypothetical protein BU26DRAFT_343815 [Trematosphaeria pertusa]
MKEQKRLILALRSFLEDKAAMQERAVAAEDDLEETEEKKKQETSVVATSIARKSQCAPLKGPSIVSGAIGSSAAGSASAKKIEEAAAPKSTARGTANTIQTAQGRGSAWASDFSRITSTNRTTSTNPITSTNRYSSTSIPSSTQPRKDTRKQSSGATNYASIGPWSGMSDTGGGKKLSKLDDEDSTKPTDGGGNDLSGNSDLTGPGPVIPSSGSGAFGDSSSGATGGGGGGGSTGGDYSGGYSSSSSSGYGGGYSGGYSGGGSGGYSGGGYSRTVPVNGGGVDPAPELATKFENTTEEEKLRVLLQSPRGKEQWMGIQRWLISEDHRTDFW